MTTILGMHVQNLNSEDFILLAADTRVSIGGYLNHRSFRNRRYIEKFQDNARKIIIPNMDTSYAFSNTGTFFDDLCNSSDIMKFYHQLSKPSDSGPYFEDRLIKNLECGHIQDISDMNAKLKNCGLSENDFIFAINDSEKLGLYSVDYGGSCIRSFSVAHGTGAKQAYDFLSNEFVIGENADDMSVIEAAIIAASAIRKASSNDDYTGGNIDMALIIPTGMVIYYDVVKTTEPNLNAKILQAFFQDNEIKTPYDAVCKLKFTRGSMQKKYIDMICNFRNPLGAYDALSFVSNPEDVLKLNKIALG